MRKNEKEIILEYINTQLTEREAEVKELQQRVRFREIYVNDSYELQNALVRYETSMQIFKDILVFLRLY
ncbi:MAG: hypothetical protein NC253_01480 [Ruminococcus sp.]|nr:hypothetical protein [Ruminococcus sp.]MCM1381164.1 hypothetical protein [Muribaculaceae bacterium]MCM1479655.1 hypothetical protein [Muribaculaceae bacterium]